MQLSAELTRAYNDQIQLEFESSFAYLQMGADFELRSLPGMASWMRQQSGEEHAHAMKFIQFVLDRGARLELKALGLPAVDTMATLVRTGPAWRSQSPSTTTQPDPMIEPKARAKYWGRPMARLSSMKIV